MSTSKEFQANYEKWCKNHKIKDSFSDFRKGMFIQVLRTLPSDKVLGDFLRENTQLDNNQKIVLEWLKNEFKRNDLQYTLWSFTEDVYERLEIGVGSLPHVEAWGKLKEKQKFEVIAAFAQWGLEQEEE